VDILWYPTDLPPLPEGVYSCINSRDWDSEPWVELAVGELPTDAVERVYINRWRRPALALGQHICHPEWLMDGEPWPSALPPTEYLQGHIPKCCVDCMCCETIKCETEPVNGEEAAQYTYYPGKANEATDYTPYYQMMVAEQADGVMVNTPQLKMMWRPGGMADLARYERSMQYGPNPLFNWSEERFIVTPETEFRHRLDMNGELLDYTIDGVEFQLQVTAVAGKGVLQGTNLKIDSSLLPPLAPAHDHATIVATGTGPGNAAAMTTQTATIDPVASPHLSGILLPPAASGYAWVGVVNESPTKTFRAYAIGGEFGGPPMTPPPDKPLDIPPQSFVMFVRAGSTVWLRVLIVPLTSP
jgi:hypothetical protein